MTLKKNVLEVWAAPWRQIARSLNHFLSPAELQRADLYVSADDRLRYVTGRALLRNLAGRYLDRSPAELDLQVGRYGKPFFSNAPFPLKFNVSHSGDWVILAFAAGLEVGLDVQLLDQGRSFRGRRILQKVLHPEEKEVIENYVDNKKVDIFYSIWTCKEAVIKAAGLGVHGTMSKFSVVPLPVKDEWKRTVLRNIKETSGFWYKTFAMDALHKGALAIQDTEKMPEVKIINVLEAGW